MLSEISQTEKDKLLHASLVCGILKTKEMNKHDKIVRGVNRPLPEGRVEGDERNRRGRLRGIASSYKITESETYSVGNTVNKLHIKKKKTKSKGQSCLISTESVNSQKKRCVDVGNLSLTDGGRFHVFTIFPTITTDNISLLFHKVPIVS